MNLDDHKVSLIWPKERPATRTILIKPLKVTQTDLRLGICQNGPNPRQTLCSMRIKYVLKAAFIGGFEESMVEAVRIEIHPPSNGGNDSRAAT